MELSMEWQTILLIAGTLLSYTFLTLVIPSIVFGPRLMKLPFALRMMGYYCIGNTIILYVVFTLEFLHISYAPTLVLLTLIIYMYFFLHIRGNSFHQFGQELYNTLNQLSIGTITIRTIRSRRKPQRDAFKAGAKRIFFEIFLGHIIEWLLLAGLTGYALWAIGSENIAEFGYHAYDVTVHTYWTNALVENDLFVAGVYPMGFHIIIYYLHTVFGIRIMDMMRIFGLVNLIFVLLNMCAFMKSIFRQRYIYVLGAFCFIGFKLFSVYGTSRYLAALPQENAVIFIFPSLAFAMAFFHYKYERGLLESVSPVEAEAASRNGDEKPEKKKLTRAEKKAAKLEAKKQAIIDKEQKSESVRFAGAGSNRERHEFERLAKKIEKERSKTDKVRAKAEAKAKAKLEAQAKARVKAEEKGRAKQPQIPKVESYEDPGVLTVDGVIAATKQDELEVMAENAMESIASITVEMPDESESENGLDGKLQIELLDDTVQSDTTTEPENLEVDTGLTDMEEIGEKPKAHIPVEEPKVRLYERIWNRYLHFVRRIQVSLGKEDTLCMFLFSLAFAMTIAVHFYATVAAVLLYIGIALGYGIRFFRPKYFIPIIKSVFLGLVIAILPFIIAVALGTPLQGSLYWALGVMRPAPEAVQDEYDDTEQDTDLDSSAVDDDNIEESDDENNESNGDKVELTEKTDSEQGGYTPGIMIKFSSYFEMVYKNTRDMMNYFIVNYDPEIRFPMGYVFFGLLLILLLVFAITFIFIREYAMNMLSVFFGLVFLDLALLGSLANLPQIMEQSRVTVFFIPFIGVGIAAACDGIVTIVFGWLRWKYVRWIPHLAALAICVLTVGYMYQNGYIRYADYYMESSGALSLNGAIISTSKIISENKKQTYTILSANEELQQMRLYGYHYEDIILLHKLEKVNTDGSAEQSDVNIMQDNPEDINDPNIFLPTKYIYIYIEKKPIMYWLGENMSKYSQGEDRVASDEGAKIRVPAGSSSNNYIGENRWVVMSHMYMWMRELIKIYPEAISKYYEDDEFVCYRMTQGTIPYNLGIDYGYNDADEELISGDQ